MTRGAYVLALIVAVARSVPALFAALNDDWTSVARWREELTLSLCAVELERTHARQDEIAVLARLNGDRAGMAMQRMERVHEARSRRFRHWMEPGWPTEAHRVD